MIEATWELIAAIIGIALVFDFTNGFHDSANSISTVVSTKVLSPRNAVVFAAFFNFVAAFGFGVAVANTISTIVELNVVSLAVVPYIVLGALIGAIAWNIITWFFGLPTSSSHALIGGLVGAGISAAGLAAIRWNTVGTVALFMVLSPIIGLICGFLFMAAILWLTRKANKQSAESHFKRLQLCSAAAYSFSHGTNDAQKTIGIILPLLFVVGYAGVGTNPNHLLVPAWVIIASYTTIAFGTLAGGWRIVRTMGYKITKLRPVQGFAAETAGAVTILGASVAGIPVSTTHVICSSIMGVGTTMGTSTVKWGVARSIVIAWVLTIPISAIIGFAAFAVIRVIIGY
ncbi:anion permease [Methanoregula sp.]|jgi:inorganic phosphate transporter, PiT family|uniref:inorganic phosphate transporter n=1 Tax=Methanoregula sp. TaxID=2052170 RepID=UPI003C23C2EA